jgi:hypothetical protein
LTAIELPPPLVPAIVDLREFAYMPLDVVRLRDSETAVRTRGDEFRCAVILWCASWHQVPASSLPHDDLILSDLAGFGRAVREWKKVREGALRGFILCSDQRLYHPVVAEKAIGSWLARLRYLWRRECDRLKKQAQRTKVKADLPDFDLWITGACPEAVPYLSSGQLSNVPEDMEPLSPGQPPNVPRETPHKVSEVKSLSQASTGVNYVNARATAAKGEEENPESTPTARPTSTATRTAVPQHLTAYLPKHLQRKASGS